jgi:Skp family chaperone for outer membrane proteins
MGYLGNQFKKATLSLALATTLATGFVATEANAQTVPVNGGVAITQVDQGGQQYRKPWENDPTYQRQIEATQRTVDANIRQARANEKAQLAQAQQRYTLEVQREANWAAALR